MRALYVEDHQVFARMAIERWLGEYQVCHVTTVREALAVVGEPFDLALVDFDLPDGKGDVVVQALRARHTELRIVGVSSHDRGNASLRNAGATAVCRKDAFDALGDLIG
ncbi:MAG: response regulator [Myxococcota bacterium]